jgi:cell division protein FtsA
VVAGVGLRTKARKYATAQRVAVVLDVGTHKVCCLVARLLPPSRLQEVSGPLSRIKILGQGYQRSRGIVAGRVADLQAAERSIRGAIAQAERSADVTVNEVYVTASFGPLYSDSFTASVDLPGGTVGTRDLHRVMRAARDYAGRGGKSVLHAAPFGYTLGYESGIIDPLGMIGDSLKVDVHAVAVDPLPLRNLRHSIERSHVAVAGVSAAAFTSGKAVITDAEAQAGVTCLDMGAGTTGVSVFSGGHLVHCDTIGIGGNHITNDIAEAFSLSLAEAERTKTLYTSVLPGPADHHTAVPADGEEYDGHSELPFCQLSKADLSDVARIRLEEMFAEVRDRLRASGVLPMSGQKIVLTGGSSELIGAAELAAHVFGKQPRLGRARPVSGLAKQDVNPAFSAPLGLLVHLLEDDHSIGVSVTPEIIQASHGYLARVGQWLRESF